MKTKAAVLYEVGKPIEIVELDLDEPRAGEVLVRYHYSGLCHSDAHIIKGDMAVRMPMVLGHEGAGIVEAVGSGVTRVKPGDHMVCSFIPSCGTCRWCSTGQQALCDMGEWLMIGELPDGRYPFSGPGPETKYGSACGIGTLSEYAVIHQNSAIKIDDDLPLQQAALVGCGVPTGWGSAVNAAAVRPGDTVIVIGIGGIGSNAVQGARYAGAHTLIAVDPVAFKREKALEFGATHAVATIPEAMEIAKSITNGNGADKTILTPGTVTDEIVRDAVSATGKAGTIVITGLSTETTTAIQLNSLELTLFKKTLKGTLFGDCNPTYDIPKILSLYRTGHLKLDELITRTYSLDQVNEGYDDMLNGVNIRGVVVHEGAC